ncbi:MAG: chloramphenicol acetyltransferase [Acidobacteria bacterium]|nr:chloramphenicol acetyltransferase [Acidobacteriota bacterium]
MAEYLDIANWARRDVYKFFRGFDKPYFNICTMLDVSNLLSALSERSGGFDESEAARRGTLLHAGRVRSQASGETPVPRIDAKANVSLAYHYFALKAANEIEPFRYRLRSDRVLVHPVIHGATTVLLPNETFTFAYFDYAADFAEFIDGAERAVAEARTTGSFWTKDDDDNMIHCTVLPWVSFTSFSHARNWKREDSVPKISFGKFVRDGERTLMPLSVEVHHALMDGFHVGRYVMRLEELLSKAERYL